MATRPRILRRIALAAALATTAGIAWQPTTSSAAPRKAAATALEWSLVGQVPGAAAQPTADGKRIATLEVWNGRVYAGYGDWGANTGPIDVQSVAVEGGEFRTDFRVDTEATHTIKAVGNKLVVPATDPRSGRSDFAMAEPWVSGGRLGATHVFDTATLTGDDLWMVGSRGNNAVAWRSLDGGASWAEMLAAPSSDGLGSARFYFAAKIGGSLVLQLVSSTTGADAHSYVFDGSSWATGRPLVGNSQQGRKTATFRGATHLLSNAFGHASHLLAFDGRRSRVILRNVIDFTVADNTLVAATSDGTLRRTVDGRKWVTIGTAPECLESLAAADGKLFIGTCTSAIWVARG